MLIPHKSILGTSRVLSVVLAVTFVTPVHCSIIAKSDAGEQSKLTMQFMKQATVSSPSEPIVFEKHYPLVLGKSRRAQLQNISVSWRPVASLQFVSPDNADTAKQNFKPTHTGHLTWLVSQNGTRLIDSKSKLLARISTLTSADVRPRDIIYNERLGTVWLYGKSIYRYRIADHILEQLQFGEANFHAIRKAVSTPSGLWLATEKGIFLLDEKGAMLNRIGNAGIEGVNIINAVSTEKESWFVTADARLVRIAHIAPNQLDLSISAKLPGTPAEIIIANHMLWMLLSDHHGDYYKLATVDQNLNQVGVMVGKYFSLNEQDSQLMASAYSTFFRIDPIEKTITTLKPTETDMLSRASHNSSVLFLGSSYIYKDNCEIVEHAKIDISKGWINALSELIFR